MRTRTTVLLLILVSCWTACDSSTSAPVDTGNDIATDSVGDAVDDDGVTADTADISADSGPAFEPWPLGPAFELDATFYEEHPGAFERMSHWATHVVAGDRPETAELGAFAVGNGHIFAIFAMTTPLNTLHNFVGPTYEKHTKFFGDYTTRLGPEGERNFVWDE